MDIIDRILLTGVVETREQAARLIADAHAAGLHPFELALAISKRPDLSDVVISSVHLAELAEQIAPGRFAERMRPRRTPRLRTRRSRHARGHRARCARRVAAREQSARGHG